MQNAAGLLVKELQEAPEETLHNLLQQEALDYYKEIFQGVKYYLETPVILKQTAHRIIWQEGSSCLQDYTVNGLQETSQHVLLCVPSLINRSYIFDLREEASFLKFLVKQNIPAMLLDWGEPGAEEEGFSLEHYIARLGRAIAYIQALTGRKIILLGYCMGGMMSLAYAQFKPEQIAGLALFATPWNFHAEDVVRFTLTDAHVQNIEALITKHAFLPKEWMQMVFYLLYTQHIHRKFQSLAQLNPESAEAKELLVVEYWANDGMKIVSGVAKNCLIDWAYHNTPMTGKWQMNGEIVVPERIGCPTMVVIGKHDRIASYHSALPLAQKIQGSRLEVMETGHVGMVAGRYAEKTLWEPFAEWVLRL